MTYSDELIHYGMPRRSGRYPWGSGKDPYQHGDDIIGRHDELKRSGMSEKEIAEAMGMSTTQLRAHMAIANNERRAYEVERVKSLKSDGYSNAKIAEIMGLPGESSVRSLLNAESEARMNKAMETAESLKRAVSKKGIIDVGTGVERDLGISPEKLKVAEEILKAEGYEVYSFRVQQVNNPGKWTTVKALCPPGTTYQEVYEARDAGEIHPIMDYETTSNAPDGTVKKSTFRYPESMDISRLKVRYADEPGPDGHTGVEKDGLVEIRRGVADLDLGRSSYAQVRILVDGDRYIKGMAVYSDDLPDGVDVVFNTNKPRGTEVRDVLKKIKDDPDNPFGSLIKEGGQSTYVDAEGKERLSLINKRAEEGDWGAWADKLPSQFLAKQDKTLIQRQLELSLSDKRAEFEDICALENPTVKKKLLKAFYEDCDASAVCLQAAALPRQKYQVIIPIPDLKDTEIYAPNYKDGEMVALVRYPHGGTFEIPILKVNNSNPNARKVIGDQPLDAVGINSNVAGRLSGADFDGDTVMVIPTNSKVRITSTPALKGLIGFDSKSYKYDEESVDSEGNHHYFRNGKEFKIMNNTQVQMGIVSNLITDMTIMGADTDELARAVRHSMVVIDAEKHKLDYRQSEIDNNIQGLKDKYQDGGGASTVLSRAKSVAYVDKRQGQPYYNIEGTKGYDPSRPEGALIYKTADDKDLYYTVTKTNKKTGEVTEVRKKRQETSTKMYETDDASTLSAGYLKEQYYVDYANALKNLANQARIEISKTGKIAYDREARKTYSEEVGSLEKKLDTALKNSPRERQAQILANSIAKAKQADNPAMDKEEYRKVKQQALTASRIKVGAHKEKVKLTDREWEAIQAGAISESVLSRILDNMDSTEIRQRATPKTKTGVSEATINRIKSLANSGYATSQIAEMIGVSTSTVRNYIKANAE
ncbi:MAG: hypothetical protein KBT27_09215 [Prevotellaceae bacterium]|nr:hypothetical protein [Candidatus Faecinaster equi]